MCSGQARTPWSTSATSCVTLCPDSCCKSRMRKMWDCHYDKGTYSSLSFYLETNLLITRCAHSTYPSGAPEFTPCFSEVRVARSLVLCVCFVDRCLSFCTFSFGHCVVCPSSLAIVLSVLLRFTDSDYPFGIFKLFLWHGYQRNTEISKRENKRYFTTLHHRRFINANSFPNKDDNSFIRERVVVNYSVSL